MSKKGRNMDLINARVAQYRATWDAKKRIREEEQKHLIENRRKRLEAKETK